MKKILIFSMILGIILTSVGVVIAGSYIQSNGETLNRVSLPENAVEVVPGVFYLGKAMDKGRVVEGYAFVHDKRENAKPPWAGGGKGGESKCYAFLVKGARWKETEQYVLGEGIDSELTKTSLETWDTEVAFDIFGTRDTVSFVNVSALGSLNYQNEVMFEDLGATSTIAYTIIWGYFSGPPFARELVEWDVLFNTYYNFGDAGLTDEENLGDTSVMDYQNIATHEFGHALGLGHPDDSCTEETMYRFADFGETKKRTLEAGDIAGIQELYKA